MKTRRLLLAALTGALILLGAQASPAEDPKPLSLAEAVKLALQNEEAVKLARKNVEEATLQKSKALKSVFPDLAVSTSWDYTHSQNPGAETKEGDTFKYVFTLNQPLYTGGRASSAVRSADKVIRINGYTYQLTREGVYFLTAQAYYNVLGALKVRNVGRQGVNLAREFLDLVKARFELGEVTRTSMLKAEYDLSLRESELTQAENRLSLARESLIKLIGRDFSVLADDQGVRAPAGPGDLPGLINRALAGRRELLMAQEAVDISREGVVFAKGRFLPVLYANAYYSRGGGDFPPEESENWSASVNLDIPIYDRGQSIGDLALARLAVEKAEIEKERIKKDIRLEVEDKFYRLTGIEKSVASLAKQVELAEENLRGIRKQYEVGLATDLEVSAATADLLGSQSQLARQEYDLILSDLALRQAAGSLSIPE